MAEANENPEVPKEEEEKQDKDRGDQGKFVNLNEEDSELKVTEEGDEPETVLEKSASIEKKEFKAVDLSYLKSNREWKDFPDLPKILVENLTKNYYKRPSKIQSLSLEFYSTNKKTALCFFGQSQNGSGKTLAYLIPSLARAIDSKDASSRENSPLVVILVHTIELAKQTKIIAKKLLQDTSLTCIVPSKEQKEKSYNKKAGKKDDQNSAGEIVITTPGYLESQLRFKKISLSRLVSLVVDEADVILDEGEKSFKYLSYIYKNIPNKNLHFLLLSATFPEKVRPIMNNLGLPKELPIRKISFTEHQLTLEGVHTMVIKLDAKQKMDFIKDALLQILGGQAIVFANDKKYCKMLLRHLLTYKLDVATIFGHPMTVDERDYVMNLFTSNKIKILITTNLLSRGIDLRRVKLVINADLPTTKSDGSWVADVKTYIHRVGRTGRFGDQGIALNIVDRSSPESEKVFNTILNHYGIKDVLQLKNPHDLETYIKEIDELNSEKRKKEEEHF